MRKKNCKCRTVELVPAGCTKCRADASTQRHSVIVVWGSEVGNVELHRSTPKDDLEAICLSESERAGGKHI